MTLTLQLAVFIAVVAFGLGCQILVAHGTHDRLHLFKLLSPADKSLIEGTKNLEAFETFGLVQWSLWALIAVAATFDTNNSPPIGQTLVGQLLGWAIITAVGVTSAQTVFSAVVGRQQRVIVARLLKEHSL